MNIREKLKASGWQITDESDVPQLKGTYAVIKRTVFGFPSIVAWTMPDDFNKFHKYEFFKDIFAYKRIDESDVFDTLMQNNDSNGLVSAVINPHKWD